MQAPRFSWVPARASSAGVEAVELAAMAGLNLDAWEGLVLDGALGERADGRWAAFEVGLVVSRQNGKGAILEARELAGLFLLDERFIVHSAHQFDTSLEAFRRLLDRIESRDEFTRRVKRVSRSHGEEGIELHGPAGRRRTGGQRIRFRTRTGGGGLGFTCDCLIVDEAMIVTEAAHGALLPTLSARPNPQVYYTGSAVDQDVHEHGVVFARIRERGIRGQDPSLAYYEWSAGVELEQAMTPKVATDPAVWAQANPALGIRISAEHIGNEQASMAPRTFAVMRLGAGDWPRTDGVAGDGIGLETWLGLEDPVSAPVDPVCFALDVTPNRSHAAIAVAGQRGDELAHVEVVEHRAGTGWAAGRAAELVKAHHATGLVIDLAGPAASLVTELRNAGLEVRDKDHPAGKLVAVTSKEHAQACGMLYDACEQNALRHLGTAELAAAIRGATRRPLGDAWAWSRKQSGVDISPLVAVTLALWGSRTIQPAELWVSFT